MSGTVLIPNATTATAAVEQMLVPEVLEALRQERAQSIDINVLLVQIVQRTQDPEVSLAQTERLLEITRKFEHQRVEDFQRRSDAIIRVKERDPDEIEKRKNNAVRRWLKVATAACALVCLVGGILCAMTGASVIVTGLMFIVGALALALIGPFASGESVSSTDAVRMIQAVTSLTRPQSVVQLPPAKQNQPEGTRALTRAPTRPPNNNRGRTNR